MNTERYKDKGKKLFWKKSLLSEFLAVESKLGSLKNVSISTSALSRSRGDGSEQSSALEHLFEFSVELSGLASLLQFLLNALRFLDILISGILGLTFLLSKGNTVVSLVPGSERSGIDGNDRVLDKSFGSHQLVVRSIVDNVQNTSLARYSFRSPGEVTVVKTHGAKLEVTSATSDDVNSLGSDLCVARRTSHHELSLLSNALSLTTGVAALMHGVPANSHRVTLCDFEKMC